MALRGRTALVTGAASGIGRAIALRLAHRGAHLALLDRDAAGLAQTAALVEAPALRISTHTVDLTDADALRQLPSAVLAAHPGLDLLINNAGVALGGRFDEIDDADFSHLLEVNVQGTVRLTRAFLPALRRSDDARIVNVASLFGVIAPPGQTAYAASKFAVRGFSMALAAELAGGPVGVTLVYPGGVATNIVANARMAASLSDTDAALLRARAARHLRTSPERAAEAIVRAVERRRARVFVGLDARILATLERLLPVSHGRVLARLGLDG